MAFFDRFRTGVRRLEQEKDCPGLIRALCGEDRAIRADAAKAICTLGIPAIPDLLGALESAGPETRSQMAEALASVGTPSIPLFLALVLRASPALQVSIAGAIAKNDSTMLGALLPALNHEHPAIRRAAVISLQRMGRRIIPPLSAALHDGDISVRKEAAAALSRLKWAPGDLQERIEFYYLLGNWAELEKFQGAAVPTLIKALSSEDAEIRSESSRTLGKIHDSRALPALIRAIGDPQVDVRIRAVEALGEMGDGRARPALVEALNSSSHQVRMEAAWALDRLGWRPQSDLQRAEYLMAKEQWNELAHMGRVAIPPLIRALEIEYSGVRIGASEHWAMGQPALDALNLEAVQRILHGNGGAGCDHAIRRRQKEAARTDRCRKTPR